MYFISYNDESNKLAMRSTGDHFPNDVYDKGVDHIPAYPTGDDANGYIYFTSREPFMVNIDYGDGDKAQKIAKKRTEGDYIVVLGSMNVPYFKNPNGGEWGTLESGGKVEAEPPHIYTDGKTEHDITFDFTSPVIMVSAVKIYCDNFPVIDMPQLESFNFEGVGMKDSEVPADRIKRIDSLNSFTMHTILDKSGGGNFRLKFPVKLLEATQLTKLDLNGVCLLKGMTEEMRSIKNLKNLEFLDLSCGINNGLGVYIKEFNELPKLKVFRFDDPGNYHYDVSEITEINPNLTRFYWQRGAGTNGGCDGKSLDNWREEFSGKSLQNLGGSIDVSHGVCLPVDVLPEYFKEMRSLAGLTGVYSFVRYNNRFDTFVNTWYDYVTSWDQITMSSTAKDGKRNQFYGTYMDFYSSYYPNTERPSGTLQAPSGFVKGSENGDPQSPMEKIYVLTNNYGETWHLKPASTASRSAHPFEMVFVDGRAIIGDGDLITSFPKEFCYSKEEAVSLCKDHGVDEKPVIDWFENRGAGIPEE